MTEWLGEVADALKMARADFDKERQGNPESLPDLTQGFILKRFELSAGGLTAASGTECHVVTTCEH